MNKYKNKRYGQRLSDGTVINWRKKKRLEKKRKLKLLVKEEELTYPVIIASPCAYHDMIVKEKVFTKNEVIAMLTDIQTEIENNVLTDDPNTLLVFLQARESCVAIIQQKIYAFLKENKGNE